MMAESFNADRNGCERHERLKNLLYLHLRHGERVAYSEPKDMVAFLGSDIPDVETNVERENLLRIWVATKFRPVVQAKSISEYPVAAVVNINEEQRDFLYGKSSPASVQKWHTLPPLVVICPPENAPDCIQVDGEDTVWVIDTTSDRALLESLRERGAILWSER